MAASTSSPNVFEPAVPSPASPCPIINFCNFSGITSIIGDRPPPALSVFVPAGASSSDVVWHPAKSDTAMDAEIKNGMTFLFIVKSSFYIVIPFHNNTFKDAVKVDVCNPRLAYIL